MLRITLRSVDDVAHGLRDRFRERRLKMDISQKELADRSGVNLHSLRRFEMTGMIAFDGLLKIAQVLDLLLDFDNVGAQRETDLSSQTLDEVLDNRRSRPRSRVRR